MFCCLSWVALGSFSAALGLAAQFRNSQISYQISGPASMRDSWEASMREDIQGSDVSLDRPHPICLEQPPRPQMPHKYLTRSLGELRWEFLESFDEGRHTRVGCQPGPSAPYMPRATTQTSNASKCPQMPADGCENRPVGPCTARLGRAV